MVSIRKAKKGFHLRKNNKYDWEKIGLALGGLVVGVVLVIGIQREFMGSSSSSIASSSSSSSSSGGIVASLTGKRKPKVPVQPHLHLQVNHHMLSEEYNAIATDILSFLDCANLFNKTLTSNNMMNGEYYGDDYFEDVQRHRRRRRRRRRLDEVSKQHGDDGGFNSRDFNNNNNNNNKKIIGEPVNWMEDGRPKKKLREPGYKHSDSSDEVDGGFQVDDTIKRQRQQGDGDEGEWFDDDTFSSSMYYISTKHLFCLAASATPPQEIVSSIQCEATASKRKSLLNLWSAARSQISETILRQVLDLGRESAHETLINKEYNLWAPELDQGLTYLLATINDGESNADHGGLHGLSENLGPNKLFVDVGSCLGITTLAITNLYPGTRIVSLEPAAPNWLFQEINLRCNLEPPELSNVHIVMAGVGPDSHEVENRMAKVMWRPTATTSTRTWTPKSEHGSGDIELIVRLRRLKSLLAEADIYDIGNAIDVLNVDCEGCEYNLIPGLSVDEFESIPTVMGNVHWGFIPTNKLPSSERGSITHERLCRHENFARTAKECCAFPKLEVISSVPNEVLMHENVQQFPPPAVTVADVAEELCDDFDDWAAKHYLFDVQNDWGWLELSSEA